MLNFRDLTTIMFILTGRQPAGSTRPRFDTTADAASLIEIAHRCDVTQGLVLHHAARTSRQLEDLNRLDATGTIDSFHMPSAQNFAEIQTHAAKFAVASELYSFLFSEMSPLSFVDAARIVHLYMPSMPSGYADVGWFDEAVGLLQLALAFRDDERARAARAAEVAAAEATAREEAKLVARREAARARRAGRVSP